ncbi:hypothetical protein PAXRUDRAFT_798178, partial [Paxillus rubicundulus Ve08.2h10]
HDALKQSIWVYLASSTTLLTQCVIYYYISTQMPKNTGPKASWSDKEVEELVLYLHNHY